MLIDTWRTLVGEAPVGWEIVEYIWVGCLAVFMFLTIVGLFRMIGYAVARGR